jgi:hypothetical protein
MADNVPVTPGVGADIATDDVGGVHYQVIKLAIGSDGSAALVDAAHPLPVMAAIRRDADGTAVADGDLSPLHTNEHGRLKVSTMPGSYADITGDITAIQASAGTPVVGGTVSGDVSRASNVMIFCSGTFSTIACTFEGSIETSGETNWFTVQAVRSNANTVETATGNLSAQPAYAWELSVNALKRFRVRCTARTSGTQSWRFVQGSYATEPIPAIQVTGTQAVSGNITNIPSTSQGASTFLRRLLSADTNAANVKNGAGVVNSIAACNDSGTKFYLKFYNKASAPTLASDVPVMTIPVPANTSVFLGCGPFGMRFATGISIAVVRGIADNDTTAVVANDGIINLSYT